LRFQRRQIKSRVGSADVVDLLDEQLPARVESRSRF
jgi:hypothetical protein